MWVTKLLISPVKKRIFCPKTTKFGPKLAFLVNLGQAMQAYSVPCWWVGWWLWRAGCISQDTYLLYPARALRALGLLLADGTPTGGRGEDFLSRQPDFFTETAVTPERKVEKSFPRWEINRHVEG